MRTTLRRSATVATVLAAFAGMLAGAPAANAGAGHASLVHSVTTYTYLNAPPRTFLSDHGRLSVIGDGSVSVLRPDGVTITLATSASVCVRVDGLPATLQNLVMGQDVNAMSDATGTQALVLRAGFPKIRPDQPGCGVVGPAVHSDITQTMSDGSTVQLQWDRGRITVLATGELHIVRPDGVTIVSHPTRNTRVTGARGYWQLRLGEHVGIISAKQLDPTTSVTTLVALEIRVHRR